MTESYTDNVELNVPDWIKTGITKGDYYIQGGVIRKTIGRKEIVYWLKPGEAIIKKTLQGINSALLGNIINIFGFGLMQINFLMVFKKLNRIESKIDDLYNLVKEIHRRQLSSAMSEAKMGCKLAYEATRMNDKFAAKQQMVIAKSSLYKADSFFSEEIKIIDPLKSEFIEFLEIICHIRFSYVRACVFLDDFIIAQDELENIKETLDEIAIKCFKRETKEEYLIENKHQRIEIVLSVRELCFQYIDEVRAIEETKAPIPFFDYKEEINV